MKMKNCCLIDCLISRRVCLFCSLKFQFKKLVGYVLQKHSYSLQLNIVCSREIFCISIMKSTKPFTV